MPTYDPDALDKMIAEAPEAGAIFYNYGKLSITPQAVKWVTNDEGARVPERRELGKDGELKQGEGLELTLKVELGEVNPALEFDYERTIAVKKSSARQVTDWTEIVEPSLKKVFGDKWATATSKKQFYVCVEDAPNATGAKSKKTGKVFGVPKFIAKFNSLAECVADREKRSAGKAEAHSNGKVPDSVVAQVKNLMTSVSGNRDMALKMLATKPFGDYEAETLLDAAK